MSFSSEDLTTPITATGSQTVFTSDWKLNDADDLLVLEFDKSTTPYTEYTRTAGAGADQYVLGSITGSTFSITFNSARTDDRIILLARLNKSLVQEEDLSNYSDFDLESLEAKLDDIVEQIQQVNYEQQRSIKFPYSTDTTEASRRYVEPVDGKVPYWDGTTGQMANSSLTITELEEQPTNAAASATAAAASATAAQTAETAAEAAQTAAETAQTAAELAETNAETAQAAAETARDEAEAAAVSAGAGPASALINVGLAASASAGALTASLKQNDGSTDPTAAAPAIIPFRSATATSGALNNREATASTSLIIPSGATLGYASGSDTYAHVYAIDNAGTPELAVIGYRKYDDDEIVSTTAISDAADDGGTLYSTSARSNVPCRYLGYVRIDAMITAGTWTTPDFISVFGVKGVYEKVEASSGLTNYTITAGTWGDITSITLPPGTWSISCQGIFYANGAITTTAVALGVSKTSGNSSPGDDGVNHLFNVANTSSGQSTPIAVADVVVTETEETTYYLKGNASNSIANLQIGYRITALRLK